MSRLPRCRGIMGLIFGHRFDPGWNPVFCSRCGFVPNRWRPTDLAARPTQETDRPEGEREFVCACGRRFLATSFKGLVPDQLPTQETDPE